MAKIELSERDRFAMFYQFNGQAVSNRAEQRRVDRLWLALDLDAVALRCEATRDPRATDFDGAKKEYEISIEQRDLILDYLDKPMSAGLSRLLFPIGNELARLRDTEV